MRKGGGAPRPDAAAAVARTSGGGSGLPDELRTRLATTAGRDLDDVRVHTGQDSDTAAKALQARAYTQGQDIHFGAGEYAPGTRDGDALIAHEVAHTLQQGGTVGAPQTKLAVTQPGDGLEREADAFAAAFGAGSEMAVRETGTGIARWHEDVEGGEYIAWLDVKCVGWLEQGSEVLDRNDFGDNLTGGFLVPDGFRGKLKLRFIITWRDDEWLDEEFSKTAWATWDVERSGGTITAKHGSMPLIQGGAHLTISGAEQSGATSGAFEDAELQIAWAFDASSSVADQATQVTYQNEETGVGGGVTEEVVSRNRRDGGAGPKYYATLVPGNPKTKVRDKAPATEPAKAGGNPAIAVAGAVAYASASASATAIVPDTTETVVDLPKSIGFSPRDSGPALTLKFEKEGQTKLSATEQAKLDALCEELAQFNKDHNFPFAHGLYDIFVEGYASNTSTKDVDETHGKQRAVGVLAELRNALHISSGHADHHKGKVVDDGDNAASTRGHAPAAKDEAEKGVKHAVDDNPFRRAEIYLSRPNATKQK